jgi:cation diffusion facilitator CzcD-associated flavoprotein CzcO
MYTLGFPFSPWRGRDAIAGGASIRDYIAATAGESGILQNILFGHRAISAQWESTRTRWIVTCEAGGKTTQFSCNFLYLATGYYDYEAGYRPQWPGESAFCGRFVHPQQWPEELELEGKRVVVIGSGATAVTLAPALVKRGAEVTLLQRSPSYVVARPSRDPIARMLSRVLPLGVATSIVRWKNVLLGSYFFSLARRRPDKARKAILALAARALPEGYDVERDFSPTYDVWDQRLCLAPDGDLFACIADGSVAVETDEIRSFVAQGIALASGKTLAADIVVTATGLVVKLLGGMTLRVDGEEIDPARHLLYKGMMLSDVPNLALAFGYTNASWTLKCDLTARYVCRLLRYMDRNQMDVCCPSAGDRMPQRKPMLAFTSGYVMRAAPLLPGQGPTPPWRVHQNYLRDLASLRFGAVADGVMQFGKAG